MRLNGTLAACGLLALWIATSIGGCATQMEGDPYGGPIEENDLSDGVGGATAESVGGASSSGVGGAGDAVTVTIGGVATTDGASSSVGGAASAASSVTSSVGGGASTAAATTTAATTTSATGVGGATSAAASTETTTVGATNAAVGGAAASTTAATSTTTTSGTVGTLSDDQCSGISNGSSCTTEGTCSPRVCGLADTGTRDCSCSGGVWDCTSCAWTQPYAAVAEPPTSPLPACTGVEADKEPCTTRGDRCDDGTEVCACWLEDSGGYIWDCDKPPSFW